MPCMIIIKFLQKKKYFIQVAIQKQKKSYNLSLNLDKIFDNWLRIF